MKRKLRLIFILGIILLMYGCTGKKSGQSQGMYWPKDHLFPMFSPPADILDDINEDDLTNAESVVFSTLQGLVNKVQPRIILTKTPEPDFSPKRSTVQESLDPWLETLGITEAKRNRIPYSDVYSLMAKYRDCIKGLVVYECPSPDVFETMSTHYANLASSIANIYGYLPVTRQIRKNIEKAGVTFSKDKIIDISELEFANGLEVFQYLYDNYWKNNSKRLLVCFHSGTYGNSPYRLTATRDIAAATEAALVGLEISTDKDNAGKLYEQFLKDMADNRTITGETASVLGWFQTEPSGVQAGTKYTVGAVPSQFFSNGTFFGGMDHHIRIPEVPKRDKLKNQIYIALYMSDGDNLHFVQNTMRLRWESAMKAGALGKIPITWTIGPGLAEIAPAMMNYFYDHAGANNCFAAGPSGAQYITPYSQPGSREGTGDYLFNTDYTDYFTELTEKYLKRTGLRTLTLWHNASDMVRASFEKNCRHLYGVTLQDRGPFESATVNNRLRFEKFTNDYCDDIQILEKTLKKHIDLWDGNKPLFVSAQIDSWNRKVGGNVAVADLVKFASQLKADYPDFNMEFVRGDHWFSFYNETNELPFNLCMLLSTKITSPDGKCIELDFGKEHKINRYVIRYAEVEGMKNPYAANSWTVETSNNQSEWVTVDKHVNNKLMEVDMDIAPIEARYMRINISDSRKVRISDVEIYGKINNESK